MYILHLSINNLFIKINLSCQTNVFLNIFQMSDIKFSVTQWRVNREALLYEYSRNCTSSCVISINKEHMPPEVIVWSV